MANVNARRAIQTIRDRYTSSNATEREWTHILQDTNWHGPDPEECCICAGAALHKTENGKGYCHAHYRQACEASQRFNAGVLGRYDRAVRSGRINPRGGASHSSRYVPQDDIERMMSDLSTVAAAA